MSRKPTTESAGARKRCLVTGAKGLLGSELTACLARQGHDVVGWDLPKHDITAVESTINGIHGVGPDIVFHLAAYTDVDGCEADAARATAVNFQGAWGVALGAAELGCPVLCVSTDYVFDGTKGTPYRESDAANPLSVYGRTKLMGERAVARSSRQHYIVRTSWLYGAGGRNFVDTIRRKAGEVPELKVVDDQTGCPTWAADLAPALLDVALSGHFGTYHVTNSGHCSWYDLAREVVRLTGARCTVLPQSTAEAARRAPRPAFSVLENHNFRRRFGRVLRPWQEALEEYVGTA
ncbi:MAG: dTDP-4-dehydrorhamnose reductase [bacterium]